MSHLAFIPCHPTPSAPREAFTRQNARAAATFCQAHLNLYPASFLNYHFHPTTFDTFAYLVEFLYDANWDGNQTAPNWAEITSFFNTLDDELGTLSHMGQGSC